MNKIRIIAFASIGALAMMFPQAKANDRDQRTVVTFSGPVQMPGKVLSAGTYVFKLAESPGDRNIVQVFSKDETHLYGTFRAIPDYRWESSDKPIITLAERGAGAPEAVKAWFYPGDNWGHEFVSRSR